MKILGKRVLVQKERIDVGGMRLGQETEEDGMQNSGIILQVGEIGLLAWLKGIRVGKRIKFHKHFLANAHSDTPSLFVETNEILSIE